MSRTAIQCACGRAHDDPSSLTKVGWQPDGTGGAALLVHCVCQSTLVAERMADACLCTTCHRLVTGADGDIKTCAWGGEGPVVLCGACFRRDPRRGQWLQWHESVISPLRRASADEARINLAKTGGQVK